MSSAIVTTMPTDSTSTFKPRKPGSGRPGVPRRKPRLSHIPQINLVTPTVSPVEPHGGTPQWIDPEYEQLCFDLLHEQHPACSKNSVAEAAESIPQPSTFTTELRLPDRTAPAEFTEHLYDSTLFMRQRTGSVELPDPKRWSSQFTCTYIEVLNGKRGIKQIERWLEERTLSQVQAEVTPVPGRTRPSLSIYSLHVSEPLDSVIEGSCLLKTGKNYRPMTFRFEGWDGRWMCTHLQIHT